MMSIKFLILDIFLFYNKIITKNLDRMLATNYNIKELSSVKTGGAQVSPSFSIAKRMTAIERMLLFILCGVEKVFDHMINVLY